jgi:hypothetical protein
VVFGAGGVSIQCLRKGGRFLECWEPGIRMKVSHIFLNTDFLTVGK